MPKSLVHYFLVLRRTGEHISLAVLFWQPHQQLFTHSSIVVYQCSTSTFEDSRECTVLDMPESVEMTVQMDWREKQQ